MTFIKQRIARFLLAAFIGGASLMPAAADTADASKAADSRTTISAVQLFPMNVASFENISPELLSFVEEVEKGLAAGEIEEIIVVGHASPDGPAALNRRLALERAQNLAAFIAEKTSLPAEKISVSSRVAEWNDVAALTAELNDSSPSDFAPLVVAAIGKNSPDPSRTLRRLEKGDVWKWLGKEIFPIQRATELTAMFKPLPQETSVPLPDPEMVELTEEEILPPPSEEPVSQTDALATSASAEEWQRGFYVKTNLPAWLALWTNIGFEIDLAPHWSAALPIYYSGFDYFRRTVKFRTFAVQPEIRWWPQARNHGFFAGAHFTMAYYNVAFNKRFRYQDHDGKTPALGGGIALGWRFRLNSDPNLTMEASVGGGVYHLDYDVFLNRPNGLLYDRRKRTFFGVDQAALSLTYKFGVGKPHQPEKKGGEI